VFNEPSKEELNSTKLNHSESKKTEPNQNVTTP
jgi:hypothetical protein